MPRIAYAPLLLLSLQACGKDKATTGEEEPAAEPVCALPAGGCDVTMADANHDCRVDVSDGVYTMRYLMNGGAAPACIDAQDMMEDDLLDIGDGLAIFYYLYSGTVELPSRSLSCDEPTAISDVSCGVLELGFEATAAVDASAGSTTSARVGVTLRSPDLAVQAWSFGVVAEGCTLTGATEDGTAIADTRLDDEGHRDMGFVRSDAVDGGLTHGAVLSWKQDTVLDPRDEAWRVVYLDLSATVPESGCVPCSLSFTDALAGAGPEVAIAVTAGGRSYVPTTAGLSFDVCAG